MQKFYVESLGCAKNQVDSECIISYLEDKGLYYTDKIEDASYIVVNTCAFIKSAKEESINTICAFLAEYPKKKLIIAGCLAERYADSLAGEFPSVAIFGNKDLSKIGEVIDKFKAEKSVVIKPIFSKLDNIKRKTLLNYKSVAYVKIAEGCSNHCSFCAIPLIRGEVRSRPLTDILEEAGQLVGRGIKEINLVAQDAASYFPNDLDKFPSPYSHPLAILLDALCKIEGDFFIRVLYIHPDNFNFEVLDCMKSNKKVLPYLDLPFQSGDDDIIKAMNRKGSFKAYTKLIEGIRKVLPSIIIRTTFLVSFPGEAEESFNRSLLFLKTIRPFWSGSFIYSKEEGTPAYKLKGRTKKSVSKERVKLLQEVQEKITSSYLLQFIGKSLRVLVEEVFCKTCKEGDADIALGRAFFQAPEVDSNVVIFFDSTVQPIQEGDLVLVRIVRVCGIDLEGRLI